MRSAAAVDKHVYAGEVAVALVGNRCDRKPQLFGLAHALFGGEGYEHAAVLSFEVAHIGRDQTGAERRDADALFAILERF